MAVFFYDREGAIGRITLSNPPYNSLDHPVFADLDELRSFLGEPSLKGVLLQGEGRHFCSGADPESFSRHFADPEKLAQALNQGKDLIRAISFARVPVVALIRGSCLGGGLEIAMGCHFRICSNNAMLGFPESVHGLLPGLGGTLYGGTLLASNHLIELLLSGRMIRGEEALHLGLADQSCPPGKLDQQGASFLNRLTASHSPRLIHTIMQAIHNSRVLPMGEALLEETRLFCRLAEDSQDEERKNGQDHD